MTRRVHGREPTPRWKGWSRAVAAGLRAAAPRPPAPARHSRRVRARDKDLARHLQPTLPDHARLASRPTDLFTTSHASALESALHAAEVALMTEACPSQLCLLEDTQLTCGLWMSICPKAQETSQHTPLRWCHQPVGCGGPSAHSTSKDGWHPAEMARFTCGLWRSICPRARETMQHTPPRWRQQFVGCECPSAQSTREDGWHPAEVAPPTCGLWMSICST